MTGDSRLRESDVRFVAHPKVMPKMQINKAFVFFAGTSDCKEFSVIVITGEKSWSQALETTVSAQPIHEDELVDVRLNQLGRALIASLDLWEYLGCNACDSAVFQLDFEAWH
jgi:hypothetical protein